ncbi:MAG TPA: hypothetical protein VGC30_15755 [Dokdonella sp.]
MDGNDACIDPPGLTRLTRGTVTYPAENGSVLRPLLNFATVWGHYSATDTEVDWPGRQPSSPIITMPRYSYVALKFTVPEDASGLFGMIQRTTYSYGINMTAAYSERCGDFNPPNPVCVSVSSDDTGAIPFPSWSLTSDESCKFVPGHSYYLNIMATNPAMAWAGCPATSANCPMGSTNYFSH